VTEPASFLIHHADLPKLRGALWKLARAGYSESLVSARLGLGDLWRRYIARSACTPVIRWISQSTFSCYKGLFPRKISQDYSMHPNEMF
jgi:hypothetical protein